MDYSQIAAQLWPALTGYFADYDSTRDLGRGTAFPASADVRDGLTAGDRFWRSDLGFLCYYDGTRWLTVHEYESGHVLVSTAVNGTQSAIRANGATYASYITRVVCVVRVSTTNNGSNFWSIAVRGLNDALTVATTIQTFSTVAAAVNTFVRGEANPPSTQVPANYSAFDIALTFGAGSPGVIDVTTTIYYRLIIT